MEFMKQINDKQKDLDLCFKLLGMRQMEIEELNNKVADLKHEKECLLQYNDIQIREKFFRNSTQKQWDLFKAGVKRDDEIKEELERQKVLHPQKSIGDLVAQICIERGEITWNGNK